MPGTRFDPSQAVTFDLERGLVHRDGAPSGVLAPAQALAALCAAAGPEATAAFARSVGAAMGRRVAARLAAGPEGSVPGPAAVRAASPEAVVDHLGGEIALAGLGALGLERWGRALVLILDRCPVGPEASGFLEALLEGALDAAAGRAVRAVVIDRDAVRARVFVGGGDAVGRVRAWLAAGVGWGEALVKLHVPPRGAA